MKNPFIQLVSYKEREEKGQERISEKSSMDLHLSSLSKFISAPNPLHTCTCTHQRKRNRLILLNASDFRDAILFQATHNHTIINQSISPSYRRSHYIPAIRFFLSFRCSLAVNSVLSTDWTGLTDTFATQTNFLCLLCPGIESGMYIDRIRSNVTRLILL